MDALPRRFAALGFSCLIISLATARADDPPLEIAAIVSMSGSYAQVGIMEARAIDTQVRFADANGGVHGRPVVLHIFDDESNTGRAYMLAGRIIAAKQAAAIIGGSTTPTCDAVHLASAENQVVQWCLSGDTMTSAEYFTSFAAPQRVFGDLPAAFFLERHLQRVASIVPDNHAGNVYRSALTSAIQADGLTLVSSNSVSSNDEAAEATANALGKHPDVIYVGGTTEIESAVIRAVHRRHKKTTVWLVNSANGSPAAATLTSTLPRGPVYSAGDALAVAPQLPSFDPQRAALMSFWGRFAHFNGGVAANTYAAIAADATGFIVTGLRNDGGIGGPALAEAIENLPPAIGLYSTYHFSPRRHNPADLSGVIVRLQRNGSLQYVESLQPHMVESPPVVVPVMPVATAKPDTDMDSDNTTYSNDMPPTKPVQHAMPIPAPGPTATTSTLRIDTE